MSAAIKIAIASLILMSSSVHALEYDLKQEESLLSLVKVTVKTETLGEFQVMPARTMRSAAQPVLTCIDSIGKQTKLAYQEKVHCSQVSWQLPLSPVKKGGFDISSQADSYDADKGWYFISEFNSFPRFTRIKTGNGLAEPIETTVCLKGSKCEILPDESQPPLFMFWGIDPVKLSINGRVIEVFSDSEQLMRTLSRWKPALDLQLNYLASLFSSNNEKEWSITYIGRDKKTGSVSGAAGNNMILVNVPLEEGELKDQSLQMLLKISAHESIHILDKRNMPVWAAEGLAEYYALKSLNKTAFKMVSPNEQWLKFKKEFPLSDTGLLKASELVSEQKQYQYYPLFYVKAPAFWQAIDEALAANGSSLDDFVSSLTFDSEDQISETSKQELQSIMGENVWLNIDQKFLLTSND